LDRRSHLSSMHTQEKNRRQNSDPQIHKDIDQCIDFIEGQIGLARLFWTPFLCDF